MVVVLQLWCLVKQLWETVSLTIVSLLWLCWWPRGLKFWMRRTVVKCSLKLFNIFCCFCVFWIAYLEYWEPFNSSCVGSVSSPFLSHRCFLWEVLVHIVWVVSVWRFFESVAGASVKRSKPCLWSLRRRWGTSPSTCTSMSVPRVSELTPPRANTCLLFLLHLGICIDNRFDDDRIPVSASCMTSSNFQAVKRCLTVKIESEERKGKTWMRLGSGSHCWNSICFTKWKAVTATCIFFSEFRTVVYNRYLQMHLLAERFVSFGWWCRNFGRGRQNLSNGTNFASELCNFLFLLFSHIYIVYGYFWTAGWLRTYLFVILLDFPACLNFLKLCKVKYYNFCMFHNVERNFIAQTGDPTGTGRGGESIFW